MIFIRFMFGFAGFFLPLEEEWLVDLDAVLALAICADKEVERAGKLNESLFGSGLLEVLDVGVGNC